MMAGNVTRTTSRLADGREMIYFDDEPSADRSQPDRRDIAEALTASEIRYDVLVDQWVVIAGHRQTRHPPPAHHPVPAMSIHFGSADRGPRQRLRRGGVREPLPVAVARPGAGAGWPAPGPDR